MSIKTKDAIQGLSAIRTILVIILVLTVGGIAAYIISVLKPVKTATETAENAYKTVKETVESAKETAENVLESAIEAVDEGVKQSPQKIPEMMVATQPLFKIPIEVGTYIGEKYTDEVLGAGASIVKYQPMLSIPVALAGKYESTKDKLQEYWGKVF